MILDSEEATHSHPLSPIVTLSVVCTLKGMCQYILFDVGGVEIHEYNRSKQCWRCRRYSTDFNALNAMYVEDVKDGVCSFYATLHTEYCYSSYSCQRCWRCQILCTLYTGPLTPARREGYSIWAFCLGGLVVHHQSVWGGSFVKFLGLVKLQGWLQARHTANPQFLKLRGCSATQ